MTRKITPSFSSCMRIEIALNFLIVLFTVLKQNLLISFCFYASFIVLFFYALDRALKKTFSLDVAALIVIALFNVTVNALLSPEADINFDYYKKIIMFSTFALLLYFSGEDSVDLKTHKFVLNLPCIAGVALILSYLLFHNTATYGGGITLNFTNPNFTGMWLLHFAVYLFLFAIDPDERKSKLLRFISLAAAAVSIWLIVLTKARSCLIGLALFVFLCLLGRKNQKWIQRKSVLVLAALFPILFVALYYLLVDKSWFLSLFSFIASEGKQLNSRLPIWNFAIQNLKSHVFLGNYCGISTGTGASQLHNTHLDVICSYGLLPFLLFIRLLYLTCKKAAQNIDSYFSYCALCGFFAIIAMGSFEAAIVGGATGLNILTAGLIVLSNRMVVKE